MQIEPHSVLSVPANGESMPGNIRNKLVAGGAWAFLGKVSGSVTALVTNALLARLLDPAEMGKYFLVFSMVTAAALVAQFGLPSTVVRMLGESAGLPDLHRKRAVVEAAARYAVASAAVVIVVAAGVGLAGAQSMLALLPLAVCWIVVLAWQEIVSALFRGMQEILNSVLFGGAAAGVILVLLLAVLLASSARMTLQEAMVSSLSCAGIGVTAGTIFLKRKVSRLPMASEPVPLGGLLKDSLPMFVAVVAGAIMNRVDLWMLGFYRTSSEVAVYGAASRLAAVISFFLLVGNTVISPVIAELAVQQRRIDLEKVLRHAALMAFLPSLLPLCCFLAGGSGILELLYGSYYRDGSTVLSILAVGTAFSVWTGSCGATLVMTGNQRIMMNITLFSSLVTVAGTTMLARDFGGVGVASASAVGMVLQNMLMLVFARRRTGIWTHVGLRLPGWGLLYRGGNR